MAIPDRVAHVKRVFRTNEDGTRDESVWVDVLRIDHTLTLLQPDDSGNIGQEVKVYVQWQDDPTDGSDQDMKSNDFRTMETRTIKNPQAPEDDSGSMKLHIIRKMTFNKSGLSTGLAGQEELLGFLNANSEEGGFDDRRLDVIKVSNNDLGGTDIKDQLVDWEDYKALLSNGQTDTDNYLYFELDRRVPMNAQTDVITGKQGQELDLAFIQDEILALFPYGDPTSESNPIPPVRIDPFQMIVNVSFFQGALFVMGDFYGNIMTYKRVTRTAINKVEDNVQQTSQNQFTQLGHVETDPPMEGPQATVVGIAYANVGADPTQNKPGTPTFVVTVTCGPVPAQFPPPPAGPPAGPPPPVDPDAQAREAERRRIVQQYGLPGHTDPDGPNAGNFLVWYDFITDHLTGKLQTSYLDWNLFYSLLGAIVPGGGFDQTGFLYSPGGWAISLDSQGASPIDELFRQILAGDYSPTHTPGGQPWTSPPMVPPPWETGGLPSGPPASDPSTDNPPPISSSPSPPPSGDNPPPDGPPGSGSGGNTLKPSPVPNPEAQKSAILVSTDGAKTFSQVFSTYGVASFGRTLYNKKDQTFYTEIFEYEGLLDQYNQYSPHIGDAIPLGVYSSTDGTGWARSGEAGTFITGADLDEDYSAYYNPESMFVDQEGFGPGWTEDQYYPLPPLTPDDNQPRGVVAEDIDAATLNKAGTVIMAGFSQPAIAPPSVKDAQYPAAGLGDTGYKPQDDPKFAGTFVIAGGGFDFDDTLLASAYASFDVGKTWELVATSWGFNSICGAPWKDIKAAGLDKP